MKAILSYLTSSVGKKAIVAVTGICLMLFVLGHMLGNLQIFIPDKTWINAYAYKLQHLGPLLWIIRLSLLAIVGAHIAATISLTIENRKARPKTYSVKGNRASTAASRTMLVSGLILFCFITFHLLHFTVRKVPGHLYDEQIVKADGTTLPVHFTLDKHWGPTLEPMIPDPHAHDTHNMMIAGFSYWYISGFYVLGMFLLALHLSHGAQSFFQTLGLRNHGVAPFLTFGARAFAWALFAGYSSIPVAILTGIVK